MYMKADDKMMDIDSKFAASLNPYSSKYAFIYEQLGTLPPNLLQTCVRTQSRIEIRIPVSQLTLLNAQIYHRQLWGDTIYTDDSDAVCILIHTGKIPVIPLINSAKEKKERNMRSEARCSSLNLDLFKIGTKHSSQECQPPQRNMHQRYNFRNISDNKKKTINYADMVDSGDDDTSQYNPSHKLSIETSIKKEIRSLVGIAVVFNVLPEQILYPSSTHYGYTSRYFWNENATTKTIANSATSVPQQKHASVPILENINDEEFPLSVMSSLQLHCIYEIYNQSEFEIDGNFVHSMISAKANLNDKRFAIPNRKEFNDDIMRYVQQISMLYNSDNEPCLAYNLSIISDATDLLKYYCHRLQNKSELNTDEEDIRQCRMVKVYIKTERADIISTSIGTIALNPKNDSTSEECMEYRSLEHYMSSFVLLMENNECRYELSRNPGKNSTIFNNDYISEYSYRLVCIAFANYSHTSEVSEEQPISLKNPRVLGCLFLGVKWQEIIWNSKGFQIQGKQYFIRKFWFHCNSNGEL